MTSIVYYDGECGICNRSVQFVWQNDPDGVFSFQPLQSPQAQATLAQFGVSEVKLTTMYLLHQDEIYARSSALVQVLRMLPSYRTHSYLLAIIPRPIRDLAYRLFAKHRYRLNHNSNYNCPLPPEDIRERFL